MKVIGFLVGLAIAASSWAQPDPTLVQKLREGGYVRHWYEHVRGDFRTSRRNEAAGQDPDKRCPATTVSLTRP